MKKILNIFKRKQKYKNTSVNYEVQDTQEIAKNGMVISEDKLLIFSDGDCVKFNTYSILPEKNINGKPLYNYYGQYIYNKIINEK